MVTYKYYAGVSSANILTRIKPLRLPLSARGRKSFVKATGIVKGFLEKGLSEIHPDYRIVHWKVMQCTETQLFCGAMLLPKNPIGFYGLSADIATAIIFTMRGQERIARGIIRQLCEAFRQLEPAD